jgi:cytochrome c5
MSVCWKKTWFAMGLLMIAACAGSIPFVSEGSLRRAQTQWPEMTTARLESGRATYVLKCSGCHSLVAPETKTAAEWKRGLDEMKTRAKLTEEETARVYEFLFAHAHDNRKEIQQ